MTATRYNIERWFEMGKKNGATHMIVVCDTFDNSDYPVYVAIDADVHAVEEEHADRSMAKIVEVYSLSMDMETQLNQDRAFNY